MKTAAIVTTALAATAAAQPVSYEKYRTDIDNFNSNRATSGFFPLILGGTEAEVGARQYIAGMRVSENGASFCGGSLIHPKWVLTAAHCINSIVWVNVGTHFRSGTADGTPVKVLRKIPHPRYLSVVSGDDVALLELQSAVSYPPVKLASASGADEPVGATATTLGWGTTREGGQNSEVLLKVDVGILSNADCSKALSVTNTMICAGGELNKDSCQNDSGGPLVINNNGTDVLVGVVSWGSGCGRLGFPGVYARVSAVRSFIDQYVPTVQRAEAVGRSLLSCN